MKKCIKKICLALMLFIGISCLYSVNADSSNYNLNFTYEGVDYNLDIEQLANENNINIDGYEYYMVAVNGSNKLVLYCSKERFNIIGTNRYNYTKAGKETLEVVINSNGTFTISTKDFENTSIAVIFEKYIVSNQNIYYRDKLVFEKNSGYEYDETKEKEETCNDVVQTKNETIVYKKAAMCYDEIGTLPVGTVIKRIKSEVNEENGHKWDKIVLSNGIEGYILSDNVQTVQNMEDIKEIVFQYDNKTYMMYFSISALQAKLGVNLNDYGYYVVAGTNSDNIKLYYSKERIIGSRGSYYHLIYGDENTLKVDMKSNGTTEESIINMKSSPARVEIEGFIVSNQNIYDKTLKMLMFEKNSGYEYDETREKTETCNDIVKVKNEMIIYEKPAMCYDEIGTLSVATVIRRIKSEVNEENGHIWDKIVLSNGAEGYVLSDTLEIVNDMTGIEFLEFIHADKEYKIYFTPSNLGVNFDEYLFYFVMSNPTSKDVIDVYYSKERIKRENGYVRGSEDAIKIEISSNGITNESIINLKNSYIVMNIDKLILSNQNIYYQNKIVFNKNDGYEYDETKEKEDMSNDIIKTNTEVIVYEKAAMCYDEIVKLPANTLLKRIKMYVNEINGHKWDKVLLSDGRMGYVFSDCLEKVENVDDIKNITFSYADKIYTIYFSVSMLQAGLGVNLNEYEYYFVKKQTTSSFLLYYSKERLRVSKPGNFYGVNGSEEAIEVAIDANGILKEKLINLKQSYISVHSGYFVASNQNIYCNGEILLSKNSGYEYDETKEKEETCNDMVKTKKETIVYEKAAMCYDELGTLSAGSVVKRIKSKVNEENGHVWDKIILSNGREAYILSDNVEIVNDMNDIKSVEFSYNDKTYKLYFSVSTLQTNLGINLNEYEYYFVKKQTTSSFLLYYSKERLRVSKPGNFYGVNGSEEAIEVAIDANGILKEKLINLKQSYISVHSGYFVASNQNIYYNKEILLSKNSGYEYDETKEKAETCNDMVKTKKETIVYEKAAMCYDELGTLSAGTVIRRIKNEVNRENGHVWDKIMLSNGREAYILSDDVEMVNDMTGIESVEFKYKDKNYKVYFTPSNLGVNFDEYLYYFVTSNPDGGDAIRVYFNKEKVRVESGGYYRQVIGGEEAIKILIDANGIPKESIEDIKNSSALVREETMIASNQDIYYDGKLFFNTLTFYNGVALTDYVVNSSWEKIPINSAAYSGIVKGEEEYNSWSPEQHEELR